MLFGGREGGEGERRGYVKGNCPFSVGGKEALDILEFCAPQVRSIGYSGILGSAGKKHRIILFWDFVKIEGGIKKGEPSSRRRRPKKNQHWLIWVRRRLLSGLVTWVSVYDIV